MDEIQILSVHKLEKRIIYFLKNPLTTTTVSYFVYLELHWLLKRKWNFVGQTWTCMKCSIWYLIPNLLRISKLSYHFDWFILKFPSKYCIVTLTSWLNDGCKRVLKQYIWKLSLKPKYSFGKKVKVKKFL